MNDCSLYNELRKCALDNPCKTAIIFYGKKYSAAKILQLIDCAAAGLRATGVKKGSVVTLCAPNTPSAQIAFYALNRLGAIINLAHPFIAPPQLKECLEKTKSELLIIYDLFLYRHKRLDTEVPVLKTESHYFMGRAAKLYFLLRKKKRSKYKNTFESLFSYAPLTDAAELFDEQEEAVYLPSGGSAGLPKTIKHSCRAFSFICQNAQYFLSEPFEDYSMMYSVLPIFHGFGLCMNMHMCAVTHVTNVMRIKFNAKTAARDIVKYKINIITGVPAMFSKLLANKEFNKADLSLVKDCFVGGDSVPQRLISAFNALLQKQGSNAKLQEGYGLAETVAACTINNRRFCKEGSSGLPIPKTQLIIVKDGQKVDNGQAGEICINSPLLMLGYYEDKDNPFIEIDGKRWLKSGDLGQIDCDGFLFFHQRIKSMIKINGVPIFPYEIERLIETLEYVNRAVATGGGKEHINVEYIKVFVEADICADREKLKKDIIKICKDNLMFYSIPKEIEFCTIPLNSMGKVDLNALKALTQH